MLCGGKRGAPEGLLHCGPTGEGVSGHAQIFTGE